MIRLVIFAYCLIQLLKASDIPSRDGYPQVIAHRGASGYVPEHSLAAYQLAIDLKTDYIEPDLCLSKDGVFVAMHDILLDDTTNVAEIEEFAGRKSIKNVDGVETTGYFVSDFTFNELKQLRLKQRLSGRTTIYNNFFQIPSLSDIYSLVQSSYSQTNRTVGIYVELKQPAFFKSIGFAMEDMLLTDLHDIGRYRVYPTESVPNNLHQVLPVVIQCFESESLQYLHDKTSIPLILLLDASGTTSCFPDKKCLSTAASYVQGIGPEKTFFGTIPLAKAVQYVESAHSFNLFLHPWTFRADLDIGVKFHGNFEQEEMYYYCCLGMDGLFSEFPDRSRQAISNMVSASGISQCSCEINH